MSAKACSARARWQGLGIRSPLLVRQTRGHFEVWLRPSNGIRRKVGQVGIDLMDDALRHGQDLLAELIDNALRQFERENRLGTERSAVPKVVRSKDAEPRRRSFNSTRS